MTSLYKKEHLLSTSESGVGLIAEMRLYCCLLLLLGATAVYAENPIAEEGAADAERWYDSSHKYVVHHADNIAQWMDGFFGDARAEEEAPYSTLRLRLEQAWDEEDNLGADFKLRGKLYLPRLSRRVSLLFSDDEEPSSTDDLIIDEQDTPDDLALQYNARNKKYYRIDFKLGLRSSGDPKGSVRYRYEHPIVESLIGRFSEEAIYRGGEGFGSRTRLELDKILSEKKVLKWRSRVDWTEEEPGITWRNGFSLDRQLSERRAVSYYISAAGETQPVGLTTSYGFGVRYRQNIFRPWLFAELQPNYRWIKEDVMSGREGVAGVLVRLEVVFERGFN